MTKRGVQSCLAVKKEAERLSESTDTLCREISMLSVRHRLLHFRPAEQSEEVREATRTAYSHIVSSASMNPSISRNVLVVIASAISRSPAHTALGLLT